jgi:hypothetical protein
MNQVETYMELSRERLKHFRLRRQVAVAIALFGILISYLANLQSQRYWAQLSPGRRFDRLEVDSFSLLHSDPLRITAPEILGTILVVCGVMLFLRVAFEQRREERATSEPQMFS